MAGQGAPLIAALLWGRAKALREIMETSQEFWERLQRLLPDDREQRLIYLLYHCGLRPAEIVALYPQQWSDVQEVICLQAIIFKKAAGFIAIDRV